MCRIWSKVNVWSLSYCIKREINWFELLYLLYLQSASANGFDSTQVKTSQVWDFPLENELTGSSLLADFLMELDFLDVSLSWGEHDRQKN